MCAFNAMAAHRDRCRGKDIWLFKKEGFEAEKTRRPFSPKQNKSPSRIYFYVPYNGSQPYFILPKPEVNRKISIVAENFSSLAMRAPSWQCGRARLFIVLHPDQAGDIVPQRGGQGEVVFFDILGDGLDP